MAYEILNGNELLVRGGLEAGFSLYTGYPGSPLAEFFNILYTKKNSLKENGIQVVIANSEANAAAMASGAKMAGQNCLVAMKSMGLHVAADALSVGNFANPGFEKNGEKSGVVIAVGDDPWSISTSTAADSRYLYKHLHIPFLEPSTPQELKDWMSKALQLSQRSSVYSGILLNTYMAEGGGRVETFPEKKPEETSVTLDTDQFDLKKNVMVPPNSLHADRAMIEERFPKVLEVLAELDLDKQFGAETSSLGFIAAGAVYETLKQYLEENHLLEKVKLYKLASSYPLIEKNLLPWLESLDDLIVVEEKRGFLENELRSLISEHKIKLNLYGKKFGFGTQAQVGFPAHGGINIEILAKKIPELLKILNFSFQDQIKIGPLATLDIPMRLPTFCPGCPHRETLSLLKELRRNFKEKGLNLISHGDVGCYSLAFLEPFKEMHDLSAMGQGGAMAAGNDLFATNPSVVLMGDSTFFHSGISAVSNSVQCGHDITYIILDNDNTAMTGHQMTPRTGIDVLGDQRPRQDIMRSIKALGVKNVQEVNPSDRYFYQNLLFEYAQKKGTKVIISDKECGLTFHSRRRKEERRLMKNGDTLSSKVFYQINTDACEDCRVCVEDTGCPGLTQTFDAYGSKVNIDWQICVNDGYCSKIKACPSFEKVEVFNYHPSLYKSDSKNHNKDQVKNFPAPTPLITLEEISQGRPFRGIVIGVGGSGVTTISRVIAEAAKNMGGRDDLDFKFVDQKGLAQRNGSVTSHFSLFKKGSSHSQTNPLGGCDIVLSPDTLEGSRALGYLSANGVLINDKKFQIPLSVLLDKGLGDKPLTSEELDLKISDKLQDRYFSETFKDISFELYGKSVYASAMILGFAFQKGYLPFSASDLMTALENAVPGQEIQNNKNAFYKGRELAVSEKNKGLESFSAEREDLIQIYEESLINSISPLESKGQLLKKFNQSLAQAMEIFPDFNQHFLARYIHDILIFDRGSKLKVFLDGLQKIRDKYQGDDLLIAIRSFAKSFFIKDEVFVAHFMISPLKNIRDQKAFADIGTNFELTFINRPSFTLFGKTIERDISPKVWMLRLMRHQRWLRSFSPAWHSKEKKINKFLQGKILSGVNSLELKKIDNIKGYRQVRYKAFKEMIGESI